MIKFINIVKTNDNSNIVLKDVNIELPNKGLITIYGDDQNTKTIFFNLLGGLDIPTSGKIIFNGQNLTNESTRKTTKNIEKYKQKNISYIFKQNNLLENLTISDNLKTINNQNNIAHDVLEKVGLIGFENKKPNELSNFDNQKIAIARTILKQSKLIMVEDFINELNSRDQVELINILKEVSKDCLVVLSSHLNDSFIQYLDGVIEVKDSVVSYKSTQIESYNQNSIIENKTNLCNKITFKSVSNKLFYKKTKVIIELLLLTICYTLITMFAVFGQYRDYKVHYNILKKDLNPGFQIEHMNIDAYNYLKSQEDVEYLDVITNKQQMMEIGYKFYPGDIEFNEGCIYISDKLLEYQLNNNYTAIINNEEIILSNDYQITDLIGNKVKPYNGSDYLTVSGIYYLDKEEFSSNGNRKETVETFNYQYRKTYVAYNPIHNESSPKRDIVNSNETLKTPNLGNHTIEIKPEKTTVETSINETTSKKYYLVVGNHIYNDLDTAPRLNDSECYVSYVEYWKEKKMELKLSDCVIYDNINNQYYLNHEFSTYDYQVEYKYDYQSLYRHKKIVYDKLIAKGFYFNESDFELDLNNEDVSRDIYVNDKLYEKVSEEFLYYNEWVKTSSIKNLKSFLKTMEKYDCTIVTPATAIIDGMLDAHQEQSVMSPQGYIILGIILIIPLLISTLLLTLMLVKTQINACEKYLNIYGERNIRKKQAFKLFLFKSLLLVIPTLSLSLILSATLINVYNHRALACYEMYLLNEELRLVNLEFISVLFMLLIVLLITNISVLFRLKKISYKIFN